MSKIPNPHDKLFRSSLSNLEVAKDFFTAHLPTSILNKINLDNLKICNNSFLDEELKEQCSDLLYYTQIDQKTGNYLYLLAEHQSSPQKLMPLRILRYQLAIITQHLQQHPKTTTLPIVFPILFYQEQNDHKPYPYSLNIFDLFHDPILAKETLTQPAHLIDITLFSDDELKKHKLAALMEYLQKHARDRDLLLIINDLKQLILDTQNQIANNEILLVTYVESCLYYILSISNVSDQKQFITQLKEIPVVKEKIMGSLAHYFEQEGLNKGLAKGIAQGKAEGLAQGKAEGLAQGKAEGIIETKKETVIYMLAEGLDLNLIQKVTKLTIKEINQIKEEKFNNL